MVKYIINSITILLSVLLAVMAVLVALNFSKLSQELSTNSLFSVDQEPMYRFMVILDGSDTSYAKEFEEGVAKAAGDYKVAYEIWKFDGGDKEESIIKQFDIAIESGVDGIVLQAFSDGRFDELLAKSNAREIPVVTVNKDIVSQEKVTFISYNDYAIGNRIGALLADFFEVEDIHEGTIVIMQDNLDDGKYLGSGIQQKISDSFEVIPEINEDTGDNALSAEGQTGQILRKYDKLVAIITSNGDETLGVIQALINRNRINDIAVIGNDDNPEILEFIRRETIPATIVTDNERLGYDGIVNLVEHNNGQFVSQYKDIRVNIVDGDNVHLYLDKEGDGHE